MLFSRHSTSRWLPILTAILVLSGAAAFRLLLLDSLGTRVPFLTFFPAVMVAVMFGGFLAGILVTVFSALLVSVCWLEPVGSLAIGNSAEWISLVIFVFSSLMVCGLSEAARRAQRRAFSAEQQAKLASERERAVGEQLALREQLATVAATVPGVIYSFRLNPDGSCCMPYVSPTLEQVCGVQPYEVHRDATAAFGVVHPDDLELLRGSIAQSAATLSPWRCEFRVNHPRRGEIWLEGNSVPQLEADGGTLWHGYLHDVSERKRSEETLRDSAQFNRQIVTSVCEGVIVYGLDLCIQVWNPYMEQLTGVPATEVLGRHPKDVFPFLEGSGVLERLERALEGEACSVEFDFFFPLYGEIRWMYDNFSPLRNAKGEIIGVIALVRDVTEGRQAQEELRSSEERFRTLVEQAADGFFVHGRDGRFIDVNRRACESLGYTREELLGMSVADLEEATPLEQIQHAWDGIEPGRFATLRGRQRRKDGSSFPVEVRLGAYRAGDQVFYVALARDMSEREQSEELIRETSRRLELAMAAGKFGVWDLEVATGRLVWSERMFRLYGLSAQAFDGNRRTWIATLHPADRDRVLAAADAALYGGQEFDTEFRMVRPDGKVKTLKADAIVVRDPQGHPLRMIGVNRDITEQRSLEAQLLQAQKMEAVGRLAGGVAHDFNNNLTVILGYAELSKLVQVNSDTFREYLDQIIKAAEHSRDITQQLLAFSRNEIIAPKLVDLNALVRQTEKTLARLIGEDVQLRLSTPEGLWPVLIDPAQVNQIIMNLAVNARDAMPAGGTLSLETRNVRLDELYCSANPEARPGDYVQLTVCDTGIGMERGMLGNIFEPFYTTKGIGKGTGLGLATVYGIVSQNGGFISVNSDPGKGAAFALFFPKAVEDGEGVVEAQRQEASGEGTVLLVEDEASVRQMAQVMLEHAGYSVLVARTPAEGLEFCRRELAIDCLLTDVIMPGMNGVELSQAVRKLRPSVGVVYMSGYTADTIAQHGVLAPGVLFIQKPFDLASLNEKIHQAIGFSQAR